ncbi:hypothetical protein vseg_019419 [Gypsophila vaccaria]
MTTSLDCLHCDHELHCNNDDDNNDNNNDNGDNSENNEHFMSLIVKEESTHTSENNNALECNNKYFVKEVRKEILEYMKRVSSHHNFKLITLVLGVNYFDRFMFSVGLHREKSWVSQLVGVASLSLASKFQEIHAPLLVDLQLDCKCIFEPKTIKRMELLILSTLQWNMNAVTPLSYFAHFFKMFKLKSHRLNREILSKFETLIIYVISDPRFLHYVPSVVATATMIQTLEELRLWRTTQHKIHHIIDTFNLNKDKVEECLEFIEEISSNDRTHKRKCCFSGNNSPTRVLDIDISETLSVSSSRLSPDQHVPKKCRTSESLSCT